MAGNLIGEPFEDYVNNQIKLRQKKQGGSSRSLEEIQYLSNKNAWIKMASGVSLKKSRFDLLSENGNSLVGDNDGKKLAQKYVLFNGLTDYTTSSPIQRAGIQYLNENPAYGVGGTDFGYSPMPGITDMEFRCLNRGSIKKATLNIKAHNRDQFDIIDVLYLRLGYTVFIEWGWNKYYDSSGSFQPMEDTLIDSEWFNDKYDKSDYSAWLPKIEERRNESGGNYDGAFGTISNFSWDFKKDGSYDIKVEIMSLGSIAESLKINLDPVVKPNEVNNSARAQIKAAISTLPQSEEEGGGIDFSAITKDKFNDIFPGVEEGIRKFIKFLKKDNNNTYFGGDNPLFDWYEDPKDGPNQLLFITDITIKGILSQTGAGDLNPITSILKTIKALDTDLYFNIGRIVVSGEITGGETSNDLQILREYFDIEALEGLKHQRFINENIIPALLISINDMFIFNSFINKKYEKTSDKETEAFLYKKKKALKFIRGNGEIIPIQKLDDVSFETYYNTNALSTFAGSFYGGDSMIVTAGNQIGLSNKLKAKLLFNNVSEKFIVNNTIKLLINQIKVDKALQKEEEEESPGTTVDSSSDPISSEILTPDAIKNQLRNKNRVNSLLYDLMERGTFFRINKQNQLLPVYAFPDALVGGNVGGETYGGILRSKEGEKKNFTFPSGDKNGVFVFKPSHLQKDGNLTVADVSMLFEDGDIMYLNEIMQGEEGSDDIVGLNQHFMRLGCFLDFIQNHNLFKIDTNSNTKGIPLIKINTDVESNICYALDNMISLDIKKMIINNDEFIRGIGEEEGIDSETGSTIKKGNKTPLLEQLNKFIIKSNETITDEITGEENIRRKLTGRIMNIYLSFSYLSSIFEEVDDEGNISLFDCLKQMATDINSSLGGVNNIEAIITADNEYRFIDQSLEPDKASDDEVILDVYGYNYINDVDNPPSNFVTNIGLSTQISKNYATMITIGATANGGVPGVEATAFSRWNIGIEDRFKNNISDKIAEENVEKFTESSAFVSARDNYDFIFKESWGLLGLDNSDSHNANDDIIKANKTATTTWYKTEKIVKALEQKEKVEKGEQKGMDIESSVGFLPFNLKIDMDGISGIKIYNRVRVNTSFLPSNYPNTLEFIITQVNHKLSNNGWTTSLETIATAKNLQI
jgi:hypothetical protein